MMNWIEIKAIIDQISYKDWKFFLGTRGNAVYLQVLFPAPDNDEPSRMAMHRGRKWLLSQHMMKSEIVQTALKAVLTAEEHEAREQFRYKGEAVFAPHFDIEALLVLACKVAPDVRQPDTSPLEGGPDSARSAPQSRGVSGSKPKSRITDNRNQTDT